MRGALAGMLGGLALALAPARAADYAPVTAVMLFAPGSAEVRAEARDALLAFLRPPRPALFRGHCLAAHADRGPGAAALSRARAEAVAAMMARQGVDPADVAALALGDRAPARLAPGGRAEPMNDRVELAACPGPRLAGVAEAEARALDAALLPGFVAALAPLLARTLGCAVPELPRGAQAMPPLDCPAEVPADAVPAARVLRHAGTQRVAVVLEWPRGLGAGEARWRALAAAGAVVDLFGLAPGPILAALGAGDGDAPPVASARSGLRAEVEAGPGALRRLRVVAAGEVP